MNAFDYFEVVCPEEAGGAAYRQIAGDVLADLDLVKVICRLHIVIDPEVPYFLAAGITRQLPENVRVGDFANVLPKEEETVLDIGNEAYLSPLLSVLWARFGRDKIDQPDRFTVIIKEPGADPAEIEALIVADPSVMIAKDLIYALQYIAPEGFKVRRQFVSGRRFYYIASENTLAEDVLETLVADAFRTMGVET